MMSAKHSVKGIFWLRPNQLNSFWKSLSIRKSTQRMPISSEDMPPLNTSALIWRRCKGCWCRLEAFHCKAELSKKLSVNTMCSQTILKSCHASTLVKCFVPALETINWEKFHELGWSFLTLLSNQQTLWKIPVSQAYQLAPERGEFRLFPESAVLRARVQFEGPHQLFRSLLRTGHSVQSLVQHGELAVHLRGDDAQLPAKAPCKRRFFFHYMADMSCRRAFCYRQQT